MLQKLLAKGRTLLADGPTGTNLFEVGLVSGENPKLWNATHPDRIRTLHKAFVGAGADIILTNSFGGNRRPLPAAETIGRRLGSPAFLDRLAALLGARSQAAQTRTEGRRWGVE